MSSEHVEIIGRILERDIASSRGKSGYGSLELGLKIVDKFHFFKKKLF